MNNNKSRGMPDVSLKQETLESIREEQTPIPEEKMFKKKNNINLKIETLDDGTKVKFPDEPQQAKPKKKLTEKQLEALKRGREKSIATRKAKKEALALEKEQWKAHKDSLKTPPQANETYQMESMEDHAPTPNAPPSTPMRQAPPPQIYQPPQLDYDKIIRGLADEQDKRSRTRENREHQVAEDIKKYEAQIREDERRRILEEVEAEEREEQLRINQKKTTSIFNPQIPVNAYSRSAYGSGGGRSRRNW
jgi:hypothetical protein